MIIRTNIDLSNQGLVKSAFERWIYFGNRDELIDLLNEDWAKTKMAERLFKEIEQEVRAEKLATDSAQERMRQQEDERDPAGYRWCAR